MLAERIMYKLFDALAFSSPSGAPPPSIPAAPASTQQKPAQVRPLNTTADVESAQTETQLQLDSSGMGKQTSSHPSAAHKPPEEDTLSHLSTSSSFSGHYNPRDDVILTLETISSRETRGLLFHIKVTTTAATVLLVLLTILKLSKPENYFTCRHRLVLLNLIVGALCLAGMLYCCAIRALSLWWARKMNRHWARRRAYIVTLTTLELTVTTLNLIFFLSANAYVLATGCTWFSNTVRWLSFAQWTCWNTLFLFLLVLASNTQPWLDKQGKPIGRLDATLADAPVTVHASKLILWVVYEALLITAFVYKPHKLAPGAIGQAPWQGSPCDTAHFICGSDPVNTAVVAVLVSITLFYLLVSLLTTIKSLRRVMRLPYQDYRMANVALRLQLKLRGPGVALFIASLICLCLIRLGSCRSFLFIWLGLLPMQLVQTTIAAVASHISNPRCMQGKDDPVLQVWLQEHAWCERDMERRKAIRRSSVPGNQSLDNEPMFCFETALKMFYWSSLVYTFQEISPAEETTVMNGNSADAKAGDGQAEDSKAVDAAAEARSLDLAMSLYQLQHFELIWEKKLDTKCLVAWNNNVVVLSFRGTASMANACADIKFWWAAHPPKRGRLCMLNRPMVHSGFLDSWLANGLNLRVVECINRVLNGKGVDRLAIKVLVTGHSLGGALATLAAYDIRKGCNLGAHNVVCLTFGAPRTGNHAFAWDYNKIVPHTWHVINDQDLVTRKGKVFIMYKRPGQRVLISRLGDLIVRPSWIEVSIRQRGGGSVAMHLLMNYKAALAAVCTAQFTKKGSRRGMQGVLDLMLDEPVRKLLALAGIDHDTVQRLQRLAKLGKRGRKALARAGGKHAKWCPAHAAAAAMGVSSDHTWKPTRLRRLDEAAADAAVAAADESLELEDFPEAEAEVSENDKEAADSLADEQEAAEEAEARQYQDDLHQLALLHGASLDQGTDTGYQDRERYIRRASSAGAGERSAWQDHPEQPSASWRSRLPFELPTRGPVSYTQLIAENARRLWPPDQLLLMGDLAAVDAAEATAHQPCSGQRAAGAQGPCPPAAGVESVDVELGEGPSRSQQPELGLVAEGSLGDGQHQGDAEGAAAGPLGPGLMWHDSIGAQIEHEAGRQADAVHTQQGLVNVQIQ